MKKVQDFSVKSYKWLNENNYIIELQSQEDIPAILPGQFAELKVPGVFLRRPLSILDYNKNDNSLSFYVKAIGKGTRKLGTLAKGETVNVIYPLGNSFNAGQTKRALIIGGGSGIAPFILLGRELQKKKIETTFLIGARTKQDVFLTDVFSLFGKVYVTTEDGSAGEKGLVTRHSVFKNEDFNFDKIFTCGPEPMMKAVSYIAAEKNVPCEVSLENMMACGFGACLCCVTETKDGNKCVCTEGPVFDTNYLQW
ncbi:MAG: dihydroorotate dehydrogenase electron transfer subunit [Bacteroidota bacterium]|nr:dihydroorotate dehydrogenase electron transfer subunit [Bacteroidota bacterium]